MMIGRTNQFVVLAPSAEPGDSIVVGPFHIWQTANRAQTELVAKGYRTEICPVLHADDVGPSPERSEPQ